jgi:deoxyribonuclease-4
MSSNSFSSENLNTTSSLPTKEQNTERRKRKLIPVNEDKNTDEALLTPLEICEIFSVGSHVPIKTTELIKCLNSYASMSTRKPYQIFLGSPQMSRMNISSCQIEGGCATIEKSGMDIFVHSQYIINLSTPGSEDWHVGLLCQNLKYASLLKCKGVVVHVGKSTKQPYGLAVENMRKNIEAVLPFASESCPLLLETPAGQGTETLKGEDEFIKFVETSFKGDPRIKVCLDTCHVFACGHDPLNFISKLLEKKLLHLVHFNDSKEPCGSYKDRHAFVGSGYIGCEKMKNIAKICSENKIPMVIE